MDQKNEEVDLHCVEEQNLDSRCKCRLAIVLKWLLFKQIVFHFSLHSRKWVSSLSLTRNIAQNLFPGSKLDFLCKKSNETLAFITVQRQKMKETLKEVSPCNTRI